MVAMQQIDKVLVFDIWGDYAHFKKIETTTSPLSYSIPTGTALSGIVATILGKARDSYYLLFSSENAKLAIRLLNPIKKRRININLIKTDDGFYLWDIKNTPRSPTPFEFVKEPKYRIYIWLKDKEAYSNLKEFLQQHKSFYTPYLGIAGMIANFSFIGEFDANIQYSKNEEIIHTIVRKDKSRLIIEKGKRYIVERIPIFMDTNRVVQEYGDVFFEANAKPIKVRDTTYYKIGDDNVVFI